MALYKPLLLTREPVFNSPRRRMWVFVALPVLLLLVLYAQAIAIPSLRKSISETQQECLNGTNGLVRKLETQSRSSLIQDALNPYPGKPRLSFKNDGTFKITVFSDLHFGENPWDDWGPEQDVNSLALMNTILADEAPDYV